MKRRTVSFTPQAFATLARLVRAHQSKVSTAIEKVLTSPPELGTGRALDRQRVVPFGGVVSGCSTARMLSILAGQMESCCAY